MTAKHWIRRIVFRLCSWWGWRGWPESGQDWSYSLKLALMLLAVREAEQAAAEEASAEQP